MQQMVSSAEAQFDRRRLSPGDYLPALLSIATTVSAAEKGIVLKLDALLDINLLAHEVADEVSVLLDIQAPAAPADVPRAPATLQVVLDRSGSMRGEPLEGVKRALVALVRRLEPSDNFGLVAFDETAQIIVPAGPLTDKANVIRRIAAITTGSFKWSPAEWCTTDLSERVPPT